MITIVKNLVKNWNDISTDLVYSDGIPVEDPAKNSTLMLLRAFFELSEDAIRSHLLKAFKLSAFTIPEYLYNYYLWIRKNDHVFESFDPEKDSKEIEAGKLAIQFRFDSVCAMAEDLAHICFEVARILGLTDSEKISNKDLALLISFELLQEINSRYHVCRKNSAKVFEFFQSQRDRHVKKLDRKMSDLTLDDLAYYASLYEKQQSGDDTSENENDAS